MKMSPVYTAVVALGVGIAGLIVTQELSFRNAVEGSGNFTSPGYGMMQPFSGSGSVAANDAITEQQADSAMQTSLQDATVDKATNSITYEGQNVTLVFFAGPENADGKFVIGSLVNPALHIQQNAHVKVEVINMDSGMPHGIEITTQGPPYAYMSMMQGGIYPGSFISPLPEAQKNTYPMATTSFTASQKGAFYYLCQVPGHAEKGMYGQLIVN